MLVLVEFPFRVLGCKPMHMFSCPKSPVPLYRFSIVPHCHSTHTHTATSSTSPTLMLSMSCTVHRLLDCLAHIRTFGFGTGTRSRGESRIWDSATRTSSRANIVRESPQSRSGPVVTNPKP